MNKFMGRSTLMGAVLALGMQQVVAAGSEFIENLPQLTPDPDRAGAMIWQKPDVDRASYTRVMIEPITLFISPESEYKGLNADELKALADKFREVLTKSLEPEIPVVNQSGAGVLYVRAALTNVKVAKKKRGLLGYTPVGFVVSTATGPTILLKDAALEIETLDSVSGERLGVLVDKAPKTAEAKDLSWDSIEKTFAFYAERFKARMQAAK